MSPPRRTPPRRARWATSWEEPGQWTLRQGWAPAGLPKRGHHSLRPSTRRAGELTRRMCPRGVTQPCVNDPGWTLNEPVLSEHKPRWGPPSEAANPRGRPEEVPKRGTQPGTTHPRAPQSSSWAEMTGSAQVEHSSRHLGTQHTELTEAPDPAQQILMEISSQAGGRRWRKAHTQR